MNCSAMVRLTGGLSSAKLLPDNDIARIAAVQVALAILEQRKVKMFVNDMKIS
jgi:hypothetical protein